MNNTCEMLSDCSPTWREPLIVEVAKVTYKDFIITIFTDSDSPRRDPRRFYYEPVVLLDPKSVTNESSSLVHQNRVSFTIQMWNTDIRSRVLVRLRSIPSLGNVQIQEDDIYVLPFEEVQLVCKSTSGIHSIRLTDEGPMSYLRLNQSLNFHFDCDLRSVASELVDSFRKNPKMIVENWQLELKCRGLAINTMLVRRSSTPELRNIEDRPCFSYKVSFSPETGILTQDLDSLQAQFAAYDEEIKDLKSRIQAADIRCNENRIMHQDDFDSLLLPRFAGYDAEIKELINMVSAANSLSNKTVSKTQELPERVTSLCGTKSAGVFSVKTCINPTAPAGQSYGFSSTAEFETEPEFGLFDLPSGIFIVKEAGLYQFHFSSNISLTNESYEARFELRVDGTPKAHYQTSLFPGYNNNTVYLPVNICALLSLKAGETVGVFPVTGNLHESAETDHVTRFTCAYFAKK